MTIRITTWSTTALLVLAILASCTRDGNDQEPPHLSAVTETDSAGVRIVESPGTVLEAALPWRVDTVPDLELGRDDADLATQFTSISGIGGVGGGGFVVVDGGSQELRWFDASGQHVRTSGGPGSGPGEFRSPLLVRRFQSDSLMVFDRRERRFTLVASDGSGARTLAPRDVAGGTPRASVGSRALFTSASGTLCAVNEPCDGPIRARWIDLASDVTDTLSVRWGRSLRYSETGTMSLLMLSPFQQRNLAAAGANGLILEGHPLFELRQFDPDGRLTAIFRVEAPPRYTPDEALELYVERYGEHAASQKEAYELMGLPEVVPAFQALLVDRLGWIWAELFRVDDGQPSAWLVFDERGRARGVVELPKELEVHEIGEDYVLGRWRDELGVEYVRRHGLERRGG
ncbi:MAG: hypothetical protein WEB88_12780 [Gemmatimonadota bacterium]